MTQASAQRRVRRPKDKAEIIDRLLQDDSPFTTYRDILIFAAGLGWHRQRRIAFEKTDEPIHWHTMTTRASAEPFINMLALSATEDVTVLSDERFEERILAFEEYANGGLEVLRSLLDQSPKSATEVIRTLVNQATAEQVDDEEGIDISGIPIDL